MCRAEEDSETLHVARAYVDYLTSERVSLTGTEQEKAKHDILLHVFAN